MPACQAWATSSDSDATLTPAFGPAVPGRAMAIARTPAGTGSPHLSAGRRHSHRTAAEAAAYLIRISRVQFDSPGTDNGSNTSLNAEWVQITNTASTNWNLTGCTLVDVQRHIFKFQSFLLGPGRTVTVHTGKGTPNGSNQYYQSSWYTWNNTGDTAYLWTRAGIRFSTFTAGSAPKVC